MTLRRPTRTLLLSLLSVPLFVGACDKEDDDKDKTTTQGGSSGDTNDSDASASATTSTMTEEECMSSHECINDVCECTTPGLEDMSCTDDEACEEECEICVEV
jgi:hypothetical protein